MVGETEWAGVRFIAVAPWDARFFRSPGLFAFIQHGPGEQRTLLYVGHADNLAAALDGEHPACAAALKLGYNELHLAPHVLERLDRLLLSDRVIRRCLPLLNLLEEGAAGHQEERSRRAG